MAIRTSQPIIVIGSINTDMVVRTDVLPRPGQTVLGGKFFMASGGKGANQAVAAARLGGSVTMVGNVGADSFGEQAKRRLQAEGIDCGFVTEDHEEPSGVALISVDAAGENHIVVAPGANNSLTNSHIDAALASLDPDSLLLMQLEIPLECVCHAIKLANHAGCNVILDPAPAQVLPPAVLKGVFLLTPNLTEAESLTGIVINSIEDAKIAVKKLVASGTKNVALTLGGAGVLLANSNGCELIPAPLMQAVDTTAAGDCFNGALAAAFARNEPLFDAAVFACSAAAISVTRIGAQESMPTWQELKR
jgi:ribokinase